MSIGTGALQTTYPGQKRADKRTFNRRILLTKKDRNRPMKMTDFARVFRPIPLRLNYRLISTIQYLQRLFIHKKITPARLVCLCFTKGFQFSLWQQQASLLSLKAMVLCISRTRNFWPRTLAKRCGLYTSLYGKLSLALHILKRYPIKAQPDSLCKSLANLIWCLVVD